MIEKKQSIEDMTAEYLKTAEKIQKRLDELSGNGRPSNEDCKRIAILRAEYKELIDAAYRLGRYSDKEDKKYGYFPLRKSRRSPKL